MGAFRLEDGRQVMDFLYDRITFLGEDRVLYEMGGKTVLAGEGGAIRELPSGAVMQPYSEEGLAWLEEGKKSMPWTGKEDSFHPSGRRGGAAFPTWPGTGEIPRTLGACGYPRAVGEIPPV